MKDKDGSYFDFAAMQLTTRGMKISTMEEVFDFVNCVDTKREVSFNVESKVNPRVGGITRSPADFVAAQHAAFVASGYPLSQIQVGTYVALSTAIRLKI